jgi:hypothetical protein
MNSMMYFIRISLLYNLLSFSWSNKYKFSVLSVVYYHFDDLFISPVISVIYFSAGN